MTMTVEEACNSWCYKNVMLLYSFQDNGAVKTNSLRQGSDLRFHNVHCSFTIIEGNYSVLNHVEIMSVLLM